MSARHETTKERAHGQWRFILPRVGIEARFLSGKNCPCPMCGGKDRFRFIDKKDGDGMWVCNQCAPSPRPAIDLVMKFTGKPFREAARPADSIISGKPIISLPKPQRQAPERKATPSTYAARVWRRGSSVRRGDAVDRYLRSRGVGLDVYPQVLRCSALDWHKDDDTGPITRWPGMF